MKHSSFFDFLRTTAALLVLFGHTRNWLFTNIGSVAEPSKLLKFFWLITVLEHEAVVIFFVLSGYLVGGNVVKKMERDGFKLLDYVVARFARIFIVYIPALIITALIFFFGNRYLQDFGGDTIRPLFSEYQSNFGGLRDALCHLSGVQGFACQTWRENPALWSLGYEWVLYLFAPSILALVLGRGMVSVRLVGIALLLCGACAMSTGITDCLFWFSTWFLGVIAWKVSETMRVPAWAGLIALGTAGVGMAVSRLNIVDGLVTDILIAISISTAVASRPLTSVDIAPRFFQWTASFSYSLYATHLPVIFLALAALQNESLPTHKIVPSRLAFSEFGIVVFTSLAFAYLFSLFTERQTERLRTWLKSVLMPGASGVSIRKADDLDKPALIAGHLVPLKPD